MNAFSTSIAWRLTLARACAWALLVAGWVGIGSLALLFAPSIEFAVAMVAFWLLGLGAAASFATRGGMRRVTRALALGLVAALTARRIGVETMDFQAACRTYNILMAEGRKVAAALLIER